MRRYKTKLGSKKREPIDKDSMRAAVHDIIYNNKPAKATAKKFHIKSVMTLKRYVKKKREAIENQRASPVYQPDYSQATVFNFVQELDLCRYLEKACKLNHGYTPKCGRELAYQYAVSLNIIYPENWNKGQAASYDWLYAFLYIRHTHLSLRKVEPTSLSRSTAFNKHNVSQFFDNLKSLYERFHFEPKDIWNIDETGITTVHTPKRVIACKGAKQVSKVTSGERGELVTVCAAISASGNHIPPFMIFPRKNWQDRMLENAPPGTDGACYPSGWMTAENFVKYLKHFKKHVRCSKENPCLIIFDNHDSHVSINSINFAKENGIHLLTIPPHTSHK